MERLLGHETQETAYVVDDYPYGFRLRCKIRYWIEHRKGFGFRFCSQTTNPKKSGEVWNKEKYGQYTEGVVVLFLDEQNHVAYDTCSWYSLDNTKKFYDTYKNVLTPAELSLIESYFVRCSR
jgi:hypothetical protein